MPLLDMPKQVPSSEVDQEILEIFAEEITDVHQEIVANLKNWSTNPAEPSSLENLQRAFHTLKGSGRMVGAAVIGELGFHFENLINKLIAGTLSKNNEILLLLGLVEKELPNMLEQFTQDQPPSENIIHLISQAASK